MAIWLSGFIAHRIDEHFFLRTLEPYFTGHEYKEVMSRLKPSSFLGFIAVVFIRLFSAPIELLMNVFIPHSQRVEALRETMVAAMPHYEKEFNDWSENRLKKEEEEEESS